jgi:hypothetical protein
MGGERETKVSPCASKAKTDNVTVCDIRVHEVNGEVHFHADSLKLKVAVPSAVWYRDWTRIVDLGGTCTFIDIERSTRLIVEVNTDFDSDEIDAHLSVSKISMGDTFSALQKFTMGK